MQRTTSQYLKIELRMSAIETPVHSDSRPPTFDNTCENVSTRVNWMTVRFANGVPMLML